MRVIPDDVHVSYAVIDNGRLDYSSGNPMYHQDQTIEVTDKELDEIYISFYLNEQNSGKIFHQYFKEKIAEKREKK